LQIVRLFPAFESKKEIATPIMMDYALNLQERPALRSAALAFLGRIALRDRDRARLRNLLKDNEPEVRQQAAAILTGYGDLAAIDAAIKRIETESGWDRVFAIRNFAKFGLEAARHGPAIRRYLKDSDWDVRARTAQTLAAIGDRGAVPMLIAAIDDRDWLLTFRAVEALAVLGGSEAQTALRSKAARHWHPAVRLAAESLLAGKPALPALKHGAIDMQEPYTRYCEPITAKDRAPDSLRFGSTQNGMDELNAWNQKNLSRYAGDFGAHPRLKSAVKPQNTLRHGEWIFTGTDRGEWGGQLTVRKGAAGTEQILLTENVRGVFLVDNQIMAVTGLAHMMDWGGFLHVLVQDSNGRWHAERRLRLTGAPDIFVAPDGTIGVWSGGGSMLVHPDGRPEWLACAPPW
jgi:HEAT repeat protein